MFCSRKVTRSPTPAFDLVLVAFLDALRIEIDAGRALGFEILDRGDRDAAVAGAEIVVHVVRADLRELQHALHDFMRRRDEMNVELGLRGHAQRIKGAAGDERRGSRKAGQFMRTKLHVFPLPVWVLKPRGGTLARSGTKASPRGAQLDCRQCRLGKPRNCLGARICPICRAF